MMVRWNRNTSRMWTNNMSSKGKPEITKNSRKDFTCMRFKPDLKQFGMESIDEDTLALLKKHVQ